MRYPKFIRFIGCVACSIAAMLVISGCSGSRADDEAADASAAAAEEAVDSRFATPEALLSQFNTMTTRDPIDVGGMLGLFYAENPRQRTMLEIGTIMTPIYPMADAMQQRFKQPIDPTSPKAFVAKANGPATLVKTEGERATATYVEHDGRAETLQLVRYNGRWWISGYTLEHQPGMKDATDDDLAFQRLSMRIMAVISPNITTRIKAGEFKSADAARQAMQAAMGQLIAQSPADQQFVRELAQRNPKYAAMFKAPAASARP